MDAIEHGSCAQPFTSDDAARLRELEELDADGVKLGADEYAELRELLNRENAAFVRAHS